MEKSRRKLILKNTKLITKNIAEKYNLDYKKLLNENMPEKIPDDQLCGIKKPTQCYKAKIDGSGFCQKHTEKLKVDEENKMFLDSMIKLKRGRKKKDTGDEKNDNEIKVYMEVIDRQKFLLDDYNRVFYYNKTNINDTCYIGVQLIDGSISYDSTYLTTYAAQYPIFNTSQETYNSVPVTVPKRRLVKKIESLDQAV